MKSLNLFRLFTFLSIFCAFASCKAVKDVKVEKDLKAVKDTSVENKQVVNHTNTYVIVYNFATHTYDTDMVHPRINYPVVFRITNINRLAYNIAISSRDSVLTLDSLSKKAAQSANSAVRPDSSLKNTPSVVVAVSAKNVTAPPKSTDKTVSKDSIADNINTYMNKQNILLDRQDELKNSLKQNSELLSKIESDSTKTDSTQKSSSLLKTKIDSIQNLLGRNSKQIQEGKVLNKTIQDYMNRILTLKPIYHILEEKYENIWGIYKLRDRLTNIASDPLLTYKSFTLTYDYLKGYCGDVLYTNQKLIKDFYVGKANFNDAYNDIINDTDIKKYLTDKGIAELNEYAVKLNDQVTALYSKLKTRDPQEDIRVSQNIINWLFSPAAYSITSTPIQPSQDLVVFDVKIKSKKTADLDNSRSFNYREYVRGGLRYDFSTGLVFSLGVGDNTYSKRAASADSSFIVRNKRNNQYIPSIAAMLHTSLRTWHNTNVGFTLGASINTSTLDINSVFPGISLMFGKSDTWIITAGPALQKVNFLQSQYQEGQHYATSTLPDVIPTDKTFRVGAFIGFSYNLTNKQKDNFKLLK